MAATPAPSSRLVPTYCYNCVAGPDLLTVKVTDGVATEIGPNFAGAGIHPGDGKPCVRAYGLIQKIYHPARILTPMRRTNPRKGRDQDPGFVPISWDEALDTVADKLKSVLARGHRDETGPAARRRQLRPWRHASALHGQLPGVPLGIRADGLQLRLRPGCQVHALRASVRRVLAPRLHRVGRHAVCNFNISLGANNEITGGAGATARHAAARCAACAACRSSRICRLPGRLRRVGSDQAEDRRRLHVRADPRLLHEHPRERLDLSS